MHKVRVTVTNRQAILHEPYDYDRLIKHWSFAVNNWHFIRNKYQYFYKGKVYYSWDGKIKFLKRNRLSAGLFWATYQDIEKNERVHFKIDRVGLRSLNICSAKHWLVSDKKYSFQNECTDKMMAAAHIGGGLVLNCTGSGKTRIAAMFASRVKEEILFVVDQLNLLEQARKDIKEHLGEKVGKVGESKFKLRRVTVATIQTLAGHTKDKKFLKWFERVKVIIIDEIHEQMNRSNFNVVSIAKPLAVYGLTATLALSKKPVRMKAFSLAGPVLYEYPLQQGMRDKVLSKGIAIQLLYNNSIQELRGWSSDEVYDQRVVRNGERNYVIGRIVRRAYRNKKYIIVLVERLKHLSKLSARLDDEGVKHAVVSGTFRGRGIKLRKRMEHQTKFESGEIRVILANKVFKKGVDIKRVDIIIDAAGRQSKEDAVQKFGRGVRRHIDKKGLIYIDISDTDEFDKGRKQKNWVAKAAKRRRRGLAKAGITIKKYNWDDSSTTQDFFKKAEVWLRKEIKHEEKRSKSRRKS